MQVPDDVFPPAQKQMDVYDGARKLEGNTASTCAPIEEEPDQEKIDAQVDKLPECVNTVGFAEDTEQPPEDDIMSDPDRLSPEKIAAEKAKEAAEQAPAAAPYLPDYDEYDEDDDETDKAEPSKGCLCCRRKAAPKDANEGRCGRGTCAPISLGKNGQQVSLESYLKSLEEKKANLADMDDQPKGGFSV